MRMMRSLSNMDSFLDKFTQIPFSRSHFARISRVLFFLVMTAISFGSVPFLIFSEMSSMIQENSSSSFLNFFLVMFHHFPRTDSNIFTAHSKIFPISFISDLITVRL